MDPVSVIGGIFAAIAGGISQLIQAGQASKPRDEEYQQLVMQIANLQMQIEEERKKSQRTLMIVGIGAVVVIVVILLFMKK